ncbi:phosphoribosyl-ATP diphosphatase [Bosea sp. CS1GBMeth4]|uniref:phosphoribosyl-ATP diphosphatase n=1 Tax=Bosea sp. CS1GBMeth4 TaxID=1892849 RepID=UPI001645000C|nr:phosphoribosyl-ATP diphosphatase [Bosea sp. CS1GBMeth4]
MTDSVQRLYAAVRAARARDPALSRTARLVRHGVPKMAKKLAEEAVEVGIEAVQGDRRAVVRESADLVYNLVVLWSGLGIHPSEIWREMDRREALYGIAEKVRKSGARGHIAAPDAKAGGGDAEPASATTALLHGGQG